ncbi:DUF3035 domain-containing protein [Marivita sp. GX14005]|uniref:DUF3035 domain-containing protein n=1 Tax=Marivita sp. GX14005 TaxID=2942276 RepID=UPI00201919C7|nr:DUF3035 domain-containing protein [Marivita sp. GX14005]MCL3881395.1 DUF3035 domain-containing protein [Marivita sp. GX14005]
MPRKIMILALVALGACSAGQGEDGETNLRQLRNPAGAPEEFSIVPNKPLEVPQTLALPQPTPGGANRTDQTPLKDAVAALGGAPSRLDAGAGIGAGDQALVARASRFGRAPAIRQELAVEDQAFRERKSLFNWRLFKTDTYNDAYRRQSLDPYPVLEAARRGGAVTPSAPPPQ